MPGVVVKDLTKKFGETVAVNDVTLEVQEREFMVLVGPSGCGKTTVLRLIAGLEMPTEGQIHIDDRLVNDLSPRDRDVAMVFQNYALYPHMSVYDNMAFGLRNRRVPKKEIDRRVAEASKMLGLDGLMRRRPRELSGGQRQRVALARAIVREPKVFLMDEPLSNLDAKLRVQTRAELTRLHRRLNVITIYVTHDQSEAMTMGDRIAVLKDGLLQQVGTPLQVYYEPANLFVAGFVGSPPMNFVNVTLAQENGALVLRNDSIRLTLPKERGNALSAYMGKEVVAGIRPEDILDSSLPGSQKPEGSPLNVIVDVVEVLGSNSLLYLKVGQETLLASVPSESQAKVGAPIEVMVDGSRCHIFDKETERAIV